MSTSIASVRDALKTNLATVTGLQCYDTVPDKPEPPCAIVQPDPDGFLFRETMGKGVVRFSFVITVLVQKSVDTASQDTLDGYLNPSGTGSVWAAIENDITLGGAASNAAVQFVRQYGEFVFNDLSYLGAEIVVGVLATGT